MRTSFVPQDRRSTFAYSYDAVGNRLTQTIDGKTITTTPEHPFYTLERGWVPTGELWRGAQIRKADGSHGTVEQIEIVRRAQTMYNLTVSEAHTFFVGEEEWLVHNDCKEFDIVKYSEKAPGFEKHHGVMDVWARHNISGYNRADAPSIVLSPQRHQLTKNWFNNWRKLHTGSIMGDVDWTKISAQEAQEMSYGMFREAKVPDHVIADYFRPFNQYIYGIPR